MKKIGILMICLLILTGCGQAKTKIKDSATSRTTDSSSLDSSFYNIVNMGGAVNRENIYSSFSSTDDFENIGRDLQVLSTEHFNTDDYTMSEGVTLERADLNQLLRRSDNPDEYPNTLQPSKGTTIENVLDPIMVSAIYEQDYYTGGGDDYELAGMSLAIVIDPRDSSNRVLDPRMSDDVANEYGRDCISKLYDYLQSKDKLKNLKYNICVYMACDTSQNTYNGRFIYSSYCDGSLGSISDLNYETVLFTSDEAVAKDEDTSNSFSVFKSNLKEGSTEAVGVIGYGKYVDDSIESMNIQITANVKTYTELVYIVSLCANELDSRFSGFDIKVVVNYQDGLAAVIVKDAGSDANSIMLI